MDAVVLPRAFARTLLPLLLLLGPPSGEEVAQAAGQDDERGWLFEDYRAIQEQDGDIVRPYRRQRNLMYALQDALNQLGYDAGGRWIVWGQDGHDPFRDALRHYQRESGFEPTGEITPAVVEALLGVKIDQPAAR